MRVMMMALAALLAAGAARAAPLEAYGKLPTMDMVAISPDADRIAFVQEVNGKQAVVIDQLNPATLIANMPPTSQKVRSVMWGDEDHVLVTQSEEATAYGVRREWYYLMSIDLKTRKITPLLGNTTGIRAMLGTPELRTRDGRVTVFAPNYYMVLDRAKNRNIGHRALMSVDLATGAEALEVMSPSPEVDERWIVDDKGALAALNYYDQTKHIWALEVRRDGAWKAIARQDTLDPPSMVGLTPDGAAVVLQQRQEAGGVHFRAVNLTDGKSVLYDSQIGQLVRLVSNPVTARMVGGRKVGIEPAYLFLDPKDQTVWDGVLNLFPDEYVDFVGWSADHAKVLVQVTGRRHGYVYALVDVPAHTAKAIGQVYDGVGANDIAEVRIVTYPAKDGLQIKALLTLPNGRDPKNLPLIVLPHAWPADHDAAGFSWLAQALASRGYAVLQPQFRGSGGFDGRLEAAGYGEWGRKMQSDLSDGVRALASQGFVDPKRVCIVGDSYAGYAALAGVTIEQGVYRCAVSFAGISDPGKFLGGPKADAEHSSSVRYWDRYLGVKDPNDPILDQISPSKHAAQASAPILLIHGKDDTTVPSEQSEIMQRELRRANKPVEFVSLRSEDHWLSREASRTQMLQATVTFLEKNNPPN
jgi:dipeptidyl aminopeptidase/acylaminoacyl peptidase